MRRVETEEISYWQMGLCVSWPCFQEGYEVAWKER